MYNKEKLLQYMELKDKLQNIIDNYKELRCSLKSAKVQIITDMPKGGGSSDKIGDGVSNSSEIEEQCKELIGFYKGLGNAVKKLENKKHRRVIELRYIEGLTFDTIAYIMGITWRHAHRLHGEALKYIELDEVKKIKNKEDI